VIVFMQPDNDVYTLQQAACCTRRIGQKQQVSVLSCRLRRQRLDAMSGTDGGEDRRIRSTSGDMPDSGLDVLNWGGESIDVVLAKRLVAKMF
jgi:hypothetical protein